MFQKTNFEIRISILRILWECVCVCVCVCACVCECECVWIFKQNKEPWLFQPKFAQKWIRIGNSEIWNKNQHPQDTLCANFWSKWTTLTFSTKICPKMDLGFEIYKTNVGIRISILEMPCVLFLPKFAQK